MKESGNFLGVQHVSTCFKSLAKQLATHFFGNPDADHSSKKTTTYLYLTFSISSHINSPSHQLGEHALLDLPMKRCHLQGLSIHIQHQRHDWGWCFRLVILNILCLNHPTADIKKMLKIKVLYQLWGHNLTCEHTIGWFLYQLWDGFISNFWPLFAVTEKTKARKADRSFRPSMSLASSPTW